MAVMGKQTYFYLRYLDTLEPSVRFDSRVMFQYWGLGEESLNTYEEWMDFVQASKDQLERLGGLDLRVASSGETFAMLTIKQSCLVLFQSQIEQEISFDTLVQVYLYFRKDASSRSLC